MSLSRRNFIKSMAILGSMHYLSPTLNLLAEGETINYYDNYLSALETPYTAPMNEHFETITSGHTIGLILYDLKKSRLMTALSSEKPLPVASAFKAGLLMYFVDQIDADVWGTVPVEYWNANSKDEMPEDFHDSWQANRVILRTLYQTIVLSDNVATGTVMAYVAQANGGTDAVTMFNVWAQDTVGISQLSGIRLFQT
jgi:beta-lactamase class A